MLLQGFEQPSPLPPAHLSFSALQTAISPPESLDNVVKKLFSRVNGRQPQEGNTSSGLACVSTAGTEIMPARVATAPGPMQLHLSGSTPIAAAAASAALEAAQKAAVLNADALRAQQYGGGKVSCAPAANHFYTLGAHTCGCKSCTDHTALQCSPPLTALGRTHTTSSNEPLPIFPK